MSRVELPYSTIQPFFLWDVRFQSFELYENRHSFSAFVGRSVFQLDVDSWFILVYLLEILFL